MINNIFCFVILGAEGDEGFAFGVGTEGLGDGELEGESELEGGEGGLGGLGVGVSLGQVEGFVEAAAWVVAGDEVGFHGEMEAAGGVQPPSEFYQLRSSGRRCKALEEFGFDDDEGLGGHGKK